MATTEKVIITGGASCAARPGRLDETAEILMVERLGRERALFTGKQVRLSAGGKEMQ